MTRPSLLRIDAHMDSHTIRVSPLRALEIVEYNPYADRRFVTARTIHDLCRSVLG